MDVRVVLVDVDDTLLDFKASAKKALASVLESHGLELTDLFWNTYWRINTGLWQDLEKGKLTQAELFSRRFRLIFSELGIMLDPEPFETAFHQALHEAAVPFAGARSFLEETGKSYPVYCATNGWQEQQEHRLDLAGLFPYVCGVFSSEGAGAPKPSTAYYAYVMDRLRQIYPDLQPSEVLMVGDSLTADIAGAKQAGMPTLHVMPGDIGSVSI